MVALLSIFFFYLSDFASSTSKSLSMSEVVLLAPGIAASLLLPGLFSGAVKRGPVGARLGLIATVLVSVAAAVVLVLVELTGETSVPLLFRSLWIGLLIVQTVVSLYAARRYLRTVQAYDEAVADLAKSNRSNARMDRFGDSEYEWNEELF
jgi:hypothetical protein